MSESLVPVAEGCALFIEAIGIGLITLFSLYALLYPLIQLMRGASFSNLYKKVRHRLGRGILLGLEFLVAADIINTVAIDLNFQTVGVLFVIVVIRTFLSFTLDLELTGQWPWQTEAGKRSSNH